MMKETLKERKNLKIDFLIHLPLLMLQVAMQSWVGIQIGIIGLSSIFTPISYNIN